MFLGLPKTEKSVMSSKKWETQRTRRRVWSIVDRTGTETGIGTRWHRKQSK